MFGDAFGSPEQSASAWALHVPSMYGFALAALIEVG